MPYNSEGLQWLRKAIDDGNIHALLTLGDIYRDGRGVVKNIGNATELYKKARNGGSLRAITALALLTLEGMETKTGLPSAIESLKETANAGDSYSMYYLGNIYYDGRYVTKDLNTAEKWYIQSSSCEYGYASLMLAEMKAPSTARTHGERDLIHAASFYTKSAHAQIARAMTRYGIILCELSRLHNGTHYSSKALKWVVQGADKGDCYAMQWLGYCYNDGRNIPKDVALARSWWFREYYEYLKQTRLESPWNGWAMQAIGRMFLEGRGVDKDVAKASAWFSKASDTGNADAMFELGKLYDGGIGVERNPKTALQLIERAASLGQKDAVDYLSQKENLAVPPK